MLVVVIIAGLLYALPNIYGESPAVQISATKGVEINASVQDRVQAILTQNNIDSRSIVFENNVVTVILNDGDLQLKTKELLAKELGKDYVVALNLAPATPRWFSYFGAKPMKLGLDLRGGVRFLMEVDITTTIQKLQEQAVESLTSDLRDKKIAFTSISKVGTDQVRILFPDVPNRSLAVEFLTSFRPDLVLSKLDGNSMFVAISPETIKRVKNDAIEQNIVILRNRVNQLGVAEPVIQRQGMERIAIELPGIQDTTLAKELLGTTATLEFRLVNTTANVDLSNQRSPRVPLDSEVKLTQDGRPVLLYKRVVLTGDHIVDSSSNLNQFGLPEVNITLDNSGGAKMFNFTRSNVGKPMATLFVEYRDNGNKDENGRSILEKHEEVINVATIQSELSTRFQITGINSLPEAKQLSLYLRAGALIAPIQIVEERTVGPSLGKQNIEQGFEACLWGVLITVIFMLIVYRLFGVFASLALVLNLVLIVGIMSLLPGATLTMPGIAGIVLTVGMAVDANVLINERIKEELRNGRTVQQAINEGYAGAWNSIFDANITTLITTAILYMVGVGSIKGFAVTLAIGVLTSMFTSIVGTRALANLVYGGKRVNKLSI